ncbi:exonuclease SbcCD subunit D [Mediterraneibacter faecis]|uniref:exonuclease SbcCD subunit D n=1 Tax=Fusicatenibacter saccharivorans TaxID=1150298 RepID=UPI002A8C9800|nr:exonuclease SbcCD subunit D [Fusicatenibacter saccharivorans]MDY5074028.1 exonuclease SbcCD subunit D [Fusicatenibacter saccharivorans]
MKLFHLSDLHIGKRVNEFSMIEDQKYILTQILYAADQEKPDGILISGDVYDRTIPTAEAVQMFDAFLTRLSEQKIPAFIISGNHDSAERLAFGSSLMGKSGIYFSKVYDGTVEKIPMQDAYGTVWIYLLPFLRPSTIRHALPERAEEVQSAADAVRIALEQTKIDEKERNVLLAHQFVTGAKRCDAEELQVGDVDQIPAELFASFEYVALGHIHSPQKVGRETVRYCGAPLKYSFSEAGQEKSITVVELKEKGSVDLRTIPLKPLHDLRKIRGTYLEVTAKSFYENRDCEDYLQVTLTDEEDVPDGMAKLRTIYPNLMRLEYDNKRTRSNAEVRAAERVEEKSELELFQEFYELQNNQPMTEVQEQFVEELLRGMKE